MCGEFSLPACAPSCGAAKGTKIASSKNPPLGVRSAFNRFLLKARFRTDLGVRTRRPDDGGLVSHLQGGHVSPGAFRDLTVRLFS
jgi:hypothetical protein